MKKKWIFVLVFILLLLLIFVFYLLFGRQKTFTITFDTNGGTEIASIEVKDNEAIKLPTSPTREGYKFVGWINEDGYVITKGMKITKDITVKASWKEPYTCPKDCTPTGNGSKCTKTTTKDLIVYKECPQGTETVERFCSAHKRQVSVGFDEDQTFVDAGILCDGNPKNFCVDYSSKYTHNDFSCPSGYFKYTYSESGLDAMTGCAKKYDKGGSSCPSGYKRSGNVCKKTETITCKAN